MLTIDERTPSNNADTLVLPTATPVTMPVFIPMVVVDESADVQVALVVMSTVVLSE